MYTVGNFKLDNHLDQIVFQIRKNIFPNKYVSQKLFFDVSMSK